MSMKIAICFSGQLRTWDKCYQNWIKLSENNKFQVDFFCHLWDFESKNQKPIIDTKLEDKSNYNHINWPSSTYLNSNQWNDVVIKINHDIQLHSKKTLDRVIDVYKPKKYLIEDFEKNQKVIDDTINLYKKDDNPVIFWSCNQFYAIMKVEELKRQYEVENNFEYDVNIRLRYDEYITEDELNKLINNFYRIKKNKVFTINNRTVDKYPFYVYGDIFWISNSETFQKICNFFNEIPNMDKSLFMDSGEKLQPENVLTHYINSVGIENVTMTIDIRVCRTIEDISNRSVRKDEIIYEEI